MTRILSHQERTVSGDLLFAGHPTGQQVAPRYLVCGDDAVRSLGSLLRDLAIPQGPVLVISDRAVHESGLSKRAMSALDNASYRPIIFAEITGEPDLEVVENLVRTARGHELVAAVGLGGGSAMDPAKLAAALYANDGSVNDADHQRFVLPSLPLALVPTTAGTGAEATTNSIYAHKGRKVIISSSELCPLIAVLDPLLTVTCPPQVTAASGMDAIAHAVETTLSTFATPLTMINSLAAVRAAARWLPTAVKDGSNLPARRAMLYAAHLAGLAVSAVVVLGHSIAYTIAARTHLPHGVTTGMSLPYCIAYNMPAADRRLALIEDEARIERGSLARWVRRLSDDLGMPRSLREVGVSADDLPEMVEECFELYPRPNNPLPFKRRRLLTLFEYLFRGDLESAIRRLPE
jgi:alcohol dehydrogenase class IV